MNGVACRKVTYSGEATITVPDGPMKGEFKARGQGEMWIADQSGLPAVVLRNRGESEMIIRNPTGTGEQSIATSSEIELSDINQPIVIQAPEGAMIPSTPAATGPAIPTQPAVSTATRTTAATPSRSATPAGADIYTAEFDGSYDRSWYGTPGVSAVVSASPRPGFVRFAAGRGNDLLPATNLDAPTLWRLASSDFIAETAVEFKPVEDYQGAGLFAWQDANNFVRLECCYGGMGSGGSGICFLKVENGEPELVTDGNTLATEASRVELRLRFSGGDKIASWWRDAAAGPTSPWQEVGSTTLPMRPVPQAGLAPGIRVGILLVVEWGGEISADFDWFRLEK